MSEQASNKAGNNGGSVTVGLPEDWVYFVYSAGLVKIGYTSDVFKRFTEIKSLSGAPVELIAIIPGTRKLEKTLHRLFKPDRRHGEWFHPSTEIRRFLGCLDEANGATMPPDAVVAVGSCLARLDIAEKRPNTNASSL